MSRNEDTLRDVHEAKGEGLVLTSSSLDTLGFPCV